MPKSTKRKTTSTAKKARKAAVAKTKQAASKASRPKYDEAASQDYIRKDYLIRRLNERISSIVRHAGVENEEVMRWQSKLSRPGSPYISKVKTYDPEKMKTDKNRRYKEKAQYSLLSRGKKDVEAMDYDKLLRLEEQTRGWGGVKKEAQEALTEQAYAQAPPFVPRDKLPKPVISEAAILDYINQKQAVREFIEGNTEAFYALIEATGWDDIRAHTTEEIYNQVRRLNMSTYKFKEPLSKIGKDYITRRDASGERRRSLGI